MFKHKNHKQLLQEERKKSNVLKTRADKQRADIDYLAMMSYVELEMPENEEE